MDGDRQRLLEAELSEMTYDEILEEIWKGAKLNIETEVDAVSLYTTFIYLTRRHIARQSSDDYSQIEHLFDEVLTLLDERFDEYGDETIDLKKNYAYFLYTKVKKAAKARELWETILATTNDVWVWLEAIFMERAYGDLEHTRRLFYKALDIVTEHAQNLFKSFVQFEREEGSRDELDFALKKINLRANNLWKLQEEQNAKKQQQQQKSKNKMGYLPKQIKHVSDTEKAELMETDSNTFTRHKKGVTIPVEKDPEISDENEEERRVPFLSHNFSANIEKKKRKVTFVLENGSNSDQSEIKFEKQAGMEAETSSVPFGPTPPKKQAFNAQEDGVATNNMFDDDSTPTRRLNGSSDHQQSHFIRPRNPVQLEKQALTIDPPESRFPEVVKSAESHDHAYPGTTSIVQQQSYSAQKDGDEAGDTVSEESSVDNVSMVQLEHPECTVYLSNLDFKCADRDIEQWFSNIKEIRMTHKTGSKMNKGFAFVDFIDSESAQKALEQDNKIVFGGRRVFVSAYRPDKTRGEKTPFKFSMGLERNKLFVRNVHYKCSAEELKEFFSEYGPVRGVRIVTHKSGNPKGIAYVEFETDQSAAQAVVQADGAKLRKRPISVALSNPSVSASSSSFAGWPESGLSSAAGATLPHRHDSIGPSSGHLISSSDSTTGKSEQLQSSGNAVASIGAGPLVPGRGSQRLGGGGPPFTGGPGTRATKLMLPRSCINKKDAQ